MTKHLAPWNVATTVLIASLLYQGAAVRADEQSTHVLGSGVAHDGGVHSAMDSRRDGQAPDDIIRKLERLEEPKDSKIETTGLDPLLDQWSAVKDKVTAKTGLTLGVAYTTFYQRLSDKKDGDNVPIEGAVGDLDIFGDWSLPGAARSWSVGFQAEKRHRILTSSAPSELGASAGSSWGTITGFNTQDFSLVQLWWQQALFDEALEFRIGEVDQSDFFDVGTMLSANLFFSNAILSNNPAIAFPGNGMGGAAKFSPGDNWYVNVGIGDANGSRTDLDFNSVFDDTDHFTAAEFGWTPTLEGYGQGYYQLTFWETDGRKARNGSGQSSGDGFALRLEQFVGEELMAFASYAKSSGETTSVRQVATIGIGVLDILGYKDDLIGAAIGWGQPRDRSLREQYVAELFYRLQITDYLQVTPDIQIIVDPSQNREDDLIAVFGLRLRLDI